MAVPQDEPDQETLHKERAQEGIREVVRQAGGRIAAASHPTVMTMLCAAACAPVAAAALGAGASIAAAVAVVGGVGGTFLAQTVERLVKRLDRSPDGPEPTIDQIRTAIETGIADALETDQAQTLELGIGSLLSAVDGAQVALDEAITSGNLELAALIIGGTERLEALIVKQYGETRTELGENTLQLQMVVGAMRRMVGLLEERTVTATLQQRSAPAWEGRNPYRGLEPFRREHAPVYFGRERLTAALAVSVRRRFIAGEIQFVTGASGSGKSSLLQAGLLEAFAKGAFQIEGSDQWPRHVIRPSHPEPDPLANLASAIAGIGGRDPEAVRQTLNERPERAEQLVRAALKRDTESPTRLVLVIDQFEELFSASIDPETRRKFIEALAAIASGQREPAGLVVLGMRGDYIDRCAEIDLLRPALANPFPVSRMRRDEMREAVTGPARAAGLHLADELVESILDDARDASGTEEFGTGALPLLSEAMRRLWEAQSRQPGGVGRELTREAYAHSGKVADAVANTADEVLASLEEPQRALARALFLHLLQITDDKVVREPRIRADLKAELGPDIDPVITAFVDGRLLVEDRASADASSGEPGSTVEVAHESLFWHWKVLREWIEEDRVLLARRSKLVSDAKEWDANEREDSFLYQGAKLAELEQEAQKAWAANPKRFPKLNALTEEFLAEAREHAARRLRTRRLTVAALASLLVIALTAGFITYTASREAAEATQSLADRESWELSQELAAASTEAGLTDGILARLLAAAAWETAETDEAWAAMTRAASNPATGLLTAGHSDGGVQSVDFSDDGSFLATGGTDGTIAIWDAETWEATPLDYVGEGGIAELRVSPDGQMLAVCSDALRIQLLDRAGRIVRELETGFGYEEVTIEFSPDGTKLAAFSTGQAKVWDLETGEVLEAIEMEEWAARGMAFAGPGDEILATEAGYDQRRFSTVADQETAAMMTELGIRSTPIGEASDSYLVTCLEGCIVRPATEGDADLPKIDVSNASNYAAHFTDDGHWIAAVDSYQRTVRVDHVDTGAAYGPLRSDSDILDIALRPDGGAMVAATSEGLQTWALDPARSRTLALSFGAYGDGAISADGSRLTLGGGETTQVWEVDAMPRLAQELPSEELGAFADPVVAPEGNAIASQSDDGFAVRILDPLTGEVMHELGFDGSTVGYMRFHDEDSLVVTHQVDPENDNGASGVTVWNIDSGEKEAEIAWETNPTGWGMDFTSDLRLFATVDGDNRIRIWDTDTGDMTAELSGHHPEVSAVDFSPDGRSLAASTGRGIAVWDTAALEDAPTVHLPQIEMESVVGYTPDGHHIVTQESPEESVFGTGKILVWDVERELVVAEIPTRSSAYEIEFAESGASIAAYSTDGIDIISVQYFTEDPYSLICEQAGLRLTDEQADRYLAELAKGARHPCSGT